MREKKYNSTSLYTWEVLSDDTYILWVRKTDQTGVFDGKFIQFSYYPKNKKMSLDQGVKIYCESIDDANYFVSQVLRCYWYDMPTEFQGRYFKLKKLQSICQKVS